MDLTNEQWTLIDSLLPADPVRADGRGQPGTDRRQVFNGILWILRTGAPWKDLPERYGKYQTVHRRFQNWGTLRSFRADPVGFSQGSSRARRSGPHRMFRG